jgi:hypothetical protein
MQTLATRNPHDARRWTREPMVWLVITLPLLAVAGSIASALLAAHGADPEVADEFRSDGLAINLDPARDRAAAALGVSASLAVADGRLGVHLAGAASPAPAALVVVLSNGARSDRDQRLTLAADGAGGYGAPLAPLADGHWYVELAPTDRAWRLTGEFTGRAPAVTLRARPHP